MAMVQCLDCAYYRYPGVSPARLSSPGRCYRRAPRPGHSKEADAESSGQTIWPLVFRDDGCGDGLSRWEAIAKTKAKAKAKAIAKAKAKAIAKAKPNLTSTEKN